MTPMQLGIHAETQIFLLATLAGAGAGAVYDCLRCLRAALPHGKVLCFAEDLLYAVFFGAVYFLFALSQTGQLRFFIFLGMILGAAVERAALGEPIVAAVRALSAFIYKILRKIFSPLFKLIDKFARFIKARFVKNNPNFLKSEKDVKKPLKV